MMRRAILPVLSFCLIGLLVALLVPLTGSAASGDPAGTRAPVAGTPFFCPVTLPNGPKLPAGTLPSSLYYGNGKLWTNLWPMGIVLVLPDQVDPDGTLDMKWPWFRGITGQWTIEGRRLDAPAPPLKASIPNGYGDRGFQVSALLFPTVGCWQVTGKVGDASLTFVTLVVRSPVLPEPATPPSATS